MSSNPGDSNLEFDDSRIKNYPDKLLLSRIREYFIAFASGDFDGMNNLESTDYNITDIPLGIIRSPRSSWFDANKGFRSLVTDVLVQAITLHGSSAPGQFAILENVVNFTLKVDPPEAVQPNLPPGIKAGDRTGMIMLSAIWWNKEGKVYHELEYGKLLWPGFDITAFDQ